MGQREGRFRWCYDSFGGLEEHTAGFPADRLRVPSVGCEALFADLLQSVLLSCNFLNISGRMQLGDPLLRGGLGVKRPR